MIAVTIATPDYADMANRQAYHFRKHSGLHTVVMLIGEGQDGYEAKLDLPNVFVKTKIVFFDADYRLIRDADFSKFRECAIYGVHDGAAHDIHAFPCPDSKKLGIPNNEYINTGLFIVDFGIESHRKAFAIARQLHEDRRNKVITIDDRTEQSFLNAGIQRSGSKLIHMHPGWNFYPYSYQHGSMPEIPRNIIGVHAAGICGVHEKARHLDAYETVFGASMYDIIPEATKQYNKWRNKKDIYETRIQSRK